MVIALIITAIVVAIDQISKLLIDSNMEIREVKPLVPGLVDLSYVEPNDGMAFGLGSGYAWVFVVVTIIVSAVLVYLITKPDFKNKLYYVSVGLIVGGGIGNMIDRIFRGGKVIDFLYFHFLPFFTCNIADVAITAGTICLIVFIIFYYGKKQKSPEGKTLTADKEA